MKIKTETELRKHGHRNDAYWVKDYQGIELCKVCDDCRDYKLSLYNPKILSGYSQNDVDEQIEESY